MKRTSIFGVGIAAALYTALFVLGAASGMLHPACFAYAGTLLPLLFAFAYFYTAAELRCFGAALLLNGVCLLLGLLAGEGNPPLIIGLLLLAGLAELLRMGAGYDTRRGVRRSFVPLAFSFYAFSAHWWTDTAGSLAEALDEMPAGYAEKMQAVIENVPLLLVMLALTVPMSILGIRIAEKAMKKQAAKLG